MDYLTWNNSIAFHFFKPEMAGSTVHLYVTEKLITDIGQESGADFSDFIAAIKTGPPGVTRQGLCVKALQSRDNWQQRELDYPPYIAYLALFVLAAGIEGTFAAHSYYPRLRTLLGEEPTTGQYPSFNRMSELWEDLEKWSDRDKSGELGIFNSTSIGKRNHIGLPLAQTLLTEEERRALPAIFAAADLDPTSPPAEEAIARLLAKHGRKQLRKRTLDLLKETRDSEELRQALLEWIIDELHDWDGTAELSDKKQIYGMLRLCCQLDSTAKRATLSLRCSTKHEFPEDDLLLFLEDNSRSFSCSEYSGVWSLPLISESDAKTVAASEFDWLRGVKMRSADGKWCLKLPASPIRVFVSGDTEGLPNFVEVRQIPTQKPFYLAAHQECLELLTIWGELSCQGFEKLQISDGLPGEWHFFKAAAACSDDLIKDKYPILAFSTNLRLELDGGIRLERGNKYFKFAPPKLILLAGSESIKVYCNNQLLDGTKSTGFYELPADIPAETKLLIEARNGEDIIRRCSLLLIENYSLPSEISAPQFDRFGHRLTRADNESAGVAGALVRNVDFPDFNFNTFLPIQGKQRILFVGKEAGQIATWPGESLPTDWEPVWAISKGRHRGQVMFCGTNLSDSAPAISKCRNRKKMREWKEILWHDRKKISPPDRPELKILWNHFQQEAKYV
ncbi:MAG: hypothetical protein JGK17_10395 [Microcoleus sp. PH2017_10_PVI_O_A]|uniref:hypothetical protein n=1 Tax=unclassified Microcoleus TaxID=2642155 RepID=UPI001E0045FF|nr:MULTISPECIES: hypothetical protein [unclassified Microcoleus]TAE78377.1 MAG: hypothetical protein EAZ83_24875 [Oscillatoriales cyanobacterium]MCC3405982.1 hypothetical protein [Microcoleus sp. PH2017_10_PVI_O_A]MCC3460011.1 hypothetical protein [Microcoleus sp. PH2017_11_PCY_U_A]MCC3478511.1 hypothetical protein [Microcoleus sp. PH2017_12_PCY_D_A]MCC3531113.1 hypothetical protein [Microcoleus sp. PH2017_21_RUC_O_A]